MNNFKAEIKIRENWVQVSAVFPFCVGELLDERLDEAQLTFFSNVEHYTPLSDVRITFIESGATTCYVLANDNSAEYPAGSGVYKHTSYLIERTKLLDGILCPSITFTNAGGKNFSGIISSGRVYASSYSSTQPLPEGFYGIPEITSPIVSSDGFTVPSVGDVGCELAYFADENDAVSEISYTSDYISGLSHFYSECDVYADGKLILASVRDERDLSAAQLEGVRTLRLDYAVCTSGITYGTTSPYYVRYYVRFECAVVQTRASLSRYTITDCVNRVLELAEPLRGGCAPRYTFDGVSYVGGVAQAPVEGSQAHKYSKVYAPEFTMTQSTLREQLKVIGGYIHAEPWLDENDVVHFLEYDSNKESERVNSSTAYISKTLKTDINQYCTEIRANAHNLVSSLSYAKGTVIEPGDGLYRSLRSDTKYVRINEKNGVAATDLPIFSVENVKCGILKSSFSSLSPTSSPWLKEPVDITPFVFEATEYGAHLSSFNGSYPYSKEYAIYYTMGEKGLHGLFYQVPDATSAASHSPFAIANILASALGEDPWDIQGVLLGTVEGGLSPRLAFQITYKPVSLAFVSHGKPYYDPTLPKYTQVYNQSDNLLESAYYGQNIKGVAARLGNVEEERTYIFASSDQAPKVGDILPIDTKQYSISAVSCEIMPRYVKCTLGLSLAFNRISEHVGVNSVKRMYEISERQTQQRQILIRDDIVISSYEPVDDGGVPFFRRNRSGRFLSAFAQDKTKYRKAPVKFARFKGYSKNMMPIGDTAFIFPCISRALGNVLHFSFAMEDNYSAGASSTKLTDSSGTVGGYFQTETPYTDFYGRVYWAALNLPCDASIGINEAELAYSLPGVNEGSEASYENVASTGLEYMHRLRKDGREIISYNIEAEYKAGDPDLIIGSALLEMCDLINGEDQPKLTTYITNVPIGKLQQYYTPSDGDKKDILECSYSGSAVELKISKSYRKSYDYWVVCTPLLSEERMVINEDGYTVTEPVTTGGKIVLAGSLKYGFSEFLGSRTLEAHVIVGNGRSFDPMDVPDYGYEDPFKFIADGVYTLNDYLTDSYWSIDAKVTIDGESYQSVERRTSSTPYVDELYALNWSGSAVTLYQDGKWLSERYKRITLRAATAVPSEEYDAFYGNVASWTDIPISGTWQFNDFVYGAADEFTVMFTFEARGITYYGMRFCKKWATGYELYYLNEDGSDAKLVYDQGWIDRAHAVFTLDGEQATSPEFRHWLKLSALQIDESRLISGTWEFHEVPDIESDYAAYLDFVSNGTAFSYMKVSYDRRGVGVAVGLDEIALVYESASKSVEVYGNTNSFSAPKWISDEYKSIDILGTQVVSAEFITFMEKVATKK